MQNHYDNDFETLLEQSIDENYPSRRNDTKSARCPFSSNARNKFRSPNNFRNKKLWKVQEKSHFNNMLLPEGWIRLFHESGMFFYCHVATKVVTWSMPYEIHSEPARFHRVPVRSIPCLSVLSQKCDSGDWDKLVKPNTAKSTNKTNDTVTTVESGTLTEVHEPIITTPTKIIPTTEPVTDIVSEEMKPDDIIVTKENEEMKEEGEIESSDENGSDELPGSNEPSLPKQYQLNSHHKPKHSRLKTLSAGDVTTPSKRAHNDPTTDFITSPPLTNHKRQKYNSDTMVSNPTKEIENAHETMSEPIIAEELDRTCRLLEPTEFHKYCEKIFTFVDEIKYVPRFIFNRKKKPLTKNPPNKTEQPVTSASVDTTVPMNCTAKLKIPKKNIFLELAGRNYACILNMYCQNAFNQIPVFTSSSMISGVQDFEVTCEINNSVYGVGEGRTKKLAKQKAIVKTLEILIPGFLQKISDGSEHSIVIDSNVVGPSQLTATNSDAPDDLFSLFDIMDITDHRVFAYATKLNSLSPYNILTECMNRHCISDSEIKCKIEKVDSHNIFKLIIGEKSVQTKCDNKREGRQLAAQYMLAKLHPHIQSWGGILRLYGPGSKPVKRFDMQEMQNLLLEDRGGVKNNLINLLRKKMLDLNEEYQGSVDKSKAKFKTSFQSIPIIVFHPDSKLPSDNKS